jgi:hypothetical protein
VSPYLKRALPWLLLLGATAVSLVLINGTGPSTCGEVPRAFEENVRTEAGGDEFGIYSSCKVINAAGTVVAEETDVNWSGVLAALGLCVGAWCLGAILVGRMAPGRGTALLVASSLVVLVALATFFL